MAPDNAAAAHVHVHTHPADSAQNPGNRAHSGPKSAPAGATRARVIPLRPDLRQEDPQTQFPQGRTARREGPAEEFRAGIEAAAEAVRESDWAREPMSVLDAARKIVPASGEASGKIAWVGMSVAGLLRLLLVGLGHLIAYAGETRIRAAVTGLVIVLSLVAAAAA